VQIRILAEAEADILDAHDWYESRRNGLGAEFELCVENALERIAEMPFVSTPWKRGARRILLYRFPYGIFYAIRNDTIFILAIFHLKRSPSRLHSTISKRRK
jgi:plasmid stabilization system protein ParE